MCQQCRAIAKLWPRDDDHEFSEEELDALVAAAEAVTVLPGPHGVGVGFTGRSCTCVDREVDDAQ